METCLQVRDQMRRVVRQFGAARREFLRAGGVEVNGRGSKGERLVVDLVATTPEQELLKKEMNELLDERARLWGSFVETFDRTASVV